jgi:hypothetical protein
MTEILVIILVGSLGLYWLAAMRCKEIAVVVARRECNRYDVQLLDQTVHQAKLSMSRDDSYQWRVWREYRFEYTNNGDTRSRGLVTMLGQKTVRVDMETFNSVIH